MRIVAHGWEAITAMADGAPVIDIQDMDVSDTDLWIASSSGSNGYRLPLTGAQDAFSILNSELDGAIAISGNTAAVYYSRPDGQVWFGSGDSLVFVARLDVSSPPPFPAEHVTISDAEALGANARVRDIGPGAMGVAVATDQGITETADGLVFTGDVEPNGDRDIRVIAGGGGQSWAGARQLYNLGSSAVINPFGGLTTEDTKIRALAVDTANGDLWVGSDDRGIARVDNANGVPAAAYDMGNSGLATNKIRHIRVETAGSYAGDVWAATDQGVARYIRARDTWITLGYAHGLTGTPDVKAIVIDEANGRRVLYAGTPGGIFHLRATP